MSVKNIYPRIGLKGELTIPGDKSISHRSIMFGAVARGTTKITNFLKGADCLSTIACFRSMGIRITEDTGTSGIICPAGDLRRGEQRNDYKAYVGHPVGTILFLCDVRGRIPKLPSYGTDHQTAYRYGRTDRKRTRQ